MQKIEYIEGDLFAAVNNDLDKSPIVIAHCCNDKGGFGAGFVLPLSRNFPIVKDQYLAWHKGTICLPYQFGLGQTQFVNTDNRIFVANMIAQTLGGVRPLFYNHLAQCMDSVAKFVIDRNNVGEHKSRIIAPLFGSALSGGDWNFVEKLIEDCWLRKDISVTIYYLKGQEPDSVLRSLTPAL